MRQLPPFFSDKIHYPCIIITLKFYPLACHVLAVLIANVECLKPGTAVLSANSTNPLNREAP